MGFNVRDDATYTQPTAVQGFSYYFSPVIYNVTYDLNDSASSPATSAASNPTTYEIIHGAQFSSPARTGYAFSGWKDSNTNQVLSSVDYGLQRHFNNFDELYSAMATRTTGDLDLVAQWTPNTYSVSYDANNGSGSMASTTCTYDIPENLRTNTFTRQCYEFAGWNTKADGTGTPYDDEEEIENLSSISNDNVTLYAQWEAIEYGGYEDDPQNPDSNNDGYGDNIAFTVPTDITFVAKADGEIMAPTTAAIENASSFGIRISSVKAETGDGWAIVSSDDFDRASAKNTMSMSFGPADNMIEISECVGEGKTTSSPAWNVSGNSSTMLSFEGQAKNLASTSGDFADIHWYVKAIG